MTVKTLCLYTEELWIQTRNTAVFRLIKEIRIQSESLIVYIFLLDSRCNDHNYDGVYFVGLDGI